MSEWHAIVTTDPYTKQRNRHDAPGTRAEAEQAAAEQHGHEHGVDTAEVSVEYLGVIPTSTSATTNGGTP